MRISDWSSDVCSSDLGTMERFPELVIAYSEGQVGWMPYVIERADKLWAERGDNSFGTSLPHKPSSYIHHRIYGCIFDDETGLRNRDFVGIDQLCFETDYPITGDSRVGKGCVITCKSRW